MSNIAIVVLDTLRKDVFDEYFSWLDGEWYENAYSTANWTGPAHASFFTGEYGSSIGVSSKSRSLDCERHVLPERLQEEGYTTRGWSANPNVSQETKFNRGFTEFLPPSAIKSGNPNLFNFEEALSEYGNLPRHRRYLRIAYESFVSDCDTVASIKYGIDQVRGKESSELADDGASVVLEQLRDTNFTSNEFLFINLMEAHTPYYPPEEFRDFEDPVTMPFGEAYLGVEDPELVREGYDAAARYLGSIYSDIYDELSESFDYIITLSDHGELLGEHHDMWNHVSGIYPELTRIPLVVSGPGFEGETDELVNLFDVHATITELAGIENEGNGVPLNERGERGPYLAEYRGPFDKSIEKSEQEGLDLERYDTDLFALIESDYYGYEDYDGWVERGNISYDHPREVLYDLVDKHGMRSVEKSKIALDDDAMDRLSDLGYV